MARENSLPPIEVGRFWVSRIGQDERRPGYEKLGLQSKDLEYPTVTQLIVPNIEARNLRYGDELTIVLEVE